MVDFVRDDVDLAIRFGLGNYPGLRSEMCLPVEVFPVCSPALAGGERPLREPADLAQHTLLHDDSRYAGVSTPTWAAWLEHAGVGGIDATRGPSFWPSHLVINAAVDGLGVALAKGVWVAADLARGTLVRPFAMSLPVRYSYYAVYPPQRAEDPRLRLFLDWVHEEIAASVSPAQ
jgi:LysR family glycine cleavage system transcriptional activator